MSKYLTYIITNRGIAKEKSPIIRGLSLSGKDNFFKFFDPFAHYPIRRAQLFIGHPLTSSIIEKASIVGGRHGYKHDKAKFAGKICRKLIIIAATKHT